MPSLLVVSGCAGRTLSSGSWSPKFKTHRDVFNNGLTVLFVEDHSVPVVSYTTWFKVGSSYEKPGATGIAHLFEHMMFKGTPRFSGKQFFQKLESKGAIVNAYTQRDATVYYEVIASKYLEQVIDMESDRLAHLTFTQADLDSERQVVKDERRLRVESNFTAQLMEELEHLAFPDHPYGWPIIGYQEDLDRLSLEQCREFFKNYYQPGNAVITIAGDFDYPTTKKWVEKYYGPIQGHEVRPLKLEEQKHSGKEQKLVLKRPVETETLIEGYFIPSMYSDDAEKLSMLSWALFGMASSRANLKLVREKQMALSVGAEADLQKFPFLFMVSAEMRRGIAAEKALEEIDSLIDEIQTRPLSKEELDRVKNGLVFATVNETKSPAGIASWLASGEFYWGDHKRVFEKLNRFYAITSEDLQKVAKKYLRKDNRVVTIMRPERSK